jgi:PAS domain S-box-containing protein
VSDKSPKNEMSEDAWIDALIETLVGYARLEFTQSLPDLRGDSRKQALVEGIRMLGEELSHRVKELDARVKEEEQRARSLSTLVEGSLNEVYVFGAESMQFVYVNHAAQRNMGYSMDELSRMSPLDIKPNISLEYFDALTADLRSGAQQKTVFVTDHARKDGSRYPIEIHLEKIAFEGRPAFAAIGLDVSARKSMEERALVSERMATVGMLAAEIAHEVNNPLAIVDARLSLLDSMNSSKTLESKSVAETVDKSRQALKRIENIVYSLRRYLRDTPDDEAIVDMGTVLQDSVDFVQGIFARDGFRLEYENRTEAPCPVRCVPGKIEQVLLNLLTNARDALSESDDKFIKLVLDQDDSMCIITVTDRGHGIEADLIDSIFQPFFTTKASRQGSGIGLAVCKRFVEECDGTIVVDSSPGVGTRFEIRFPVAETEVRAKEERPQRVQAPRHVRLSGNVLLAEDESELRDYLTGVLQNAGLQVTAVENGELAWDCYRNAETPFSLVLTDLKMPGMDGVELLTRVSKNGEDASVPVRIGITGDITVGVKKEDPVYSVSDVLIYKPVTSGNLLQVLSSLMAPSS